MKRIFLFSCLILSTLVLFIAYNKLIPTTILEVITPTRTETEIVYNSKGPVPYQLYELIEKYATTYDVPRYIAYNIAYMETRYKGPFHKGYNNNVSSSVGASGPMQIMPATAKLVNKRTISGQELRTNLDLNVKTSMKLLSILHDKYGSWKLVCGAYNTGRPIVNDYALYCSTNMNYRKKWIEPNVF
jgi:soluble lytic murein transglycosylase